MRQAWTAAVPTIARAPAGSSVRRNKLSSPESRTNESLSSCAARVPTGNVPDGTPLVARGVPAVRVAQVDSTTRKGCSDPVVGAKSKSLSGNVSVELGKLDSSNEKSSVELNDESTGEKDSNV